ncbi:hypothetical protein ACROYT_G036977 [Oculina patagonica]
MASCSFNEEEVEEAWEDSVTKCNKEHKRTGQNEEELEDVYHTGYLETSDPDVEVCIKKKIKEMFKNGVLYRDIMFQLLQKEHELTIGMYEGVSSEESPQYRLLTAVIPKDYLLDMYKQYIEVCRKKCNDRMAKAESFFQQELDIVTKDIVRRIDGVVRVQRKKTDSRVNGTGTGVVVRINLSGTTYSPRVGTGGRTNEQDDFVILTNNHVIANDTEAEGATINFFYNAAAGNKTQGAPPSEVVTKSVTKVITWSPRVPAGTRASSEKMDFSILKFDVGTDESFIKKLRQASFYLNEFLENDLKNRPTITFTKVLPLLAISHPHGSNKRISFGIAGEEEVERMCSADTVGGTEGYDIQYDLTTCLGSSGCPVLAIQVNSLRVSVLLIAFLSVLGKGLQVIPFDDKKVGTIFLNLGQFLVMAGGPVAIGAPPLVSATWFPSSERTTATAIGTLAGYFGIAIAFAVGPAMVPN